jgi:hypothetical protein
MTTITVEQAADLKKDLEKTILSEILSFEEQTGLRVTLIYLQAIPSSEGKTYTSSVDVHCRLP